MGAITGKFLDGHPLSLSNLGALSIEDIKRDMTSFFRIQLEVDFDFSVLVTFIEVRADEYIVNARSGGKCY